MAEGDQAVELVDSQDHSALHSEDSQELALFDMMPPPDLLSSPVDENSWKKKHHRRARKGRKRLSTDLSSPKKIEIDENTIKSPEGARSQLKSPTKVPMSSVARLGVPPGSKKKRPVYLRPTNGPLLNAPKNSTQFIIDDHESDADLYLENPGQSGHGGVESRSTPARRAPPSPKENDRENLSPDDDSFWAAYSERDFQSVYETAHHEEVSKWDRKKLCDEISSLERRQRELVNILARVDPEIYVQKLQTELSKLQETNRRLRQEQSEQNPALPDSSSMTSGATTTTTTPTPLPGEEDDEGQGGSNSAREESSTIDATSPVNGLNVGQADVEMPQSPVRDG
ncbi:protein HEXIM1-like [Tigriopus californicus]|nr:protein HEXIM1-like [Tigriopus californicus]XP_059078467.1 protein HEXIM1-like [Tigriopus californicus]